MHQKLGGILLKQRKIQQGTSAAEKRAGRNGSPKSWIFKIREHPVQRTGAPKRRAGQVHSSPPATSSIRTRRNLTGGGAGRGLMPSSPSASCAHLPRPLLRMPGCPTLCWRPASRGGSPRPYTITAATIDVGRVRVYVYRESARNSAIPQAGFIVAPTHVLEFSTSEYVSDSRRKTTSRLIGAPTKFGRVTRPTMPDPCLRVGLAR